MDGVQEFIEDLKAGKSVADIVRPYSKIRLRKRRMRKKFEKAPSRYLGFATFVRLYAALSIMPISRSLGYAEIGKAILKVDELPPGAIDYDRRIVAAIKKDENPDE